ncbi:uncharacterized protein LOC143796543 [Ranitomeya variabilis]|uniref:uncharacterized protein LOC143796543 n=1 Tax=Ranitomeya variabilis TaxID=490064 RepID=UPI004057B117
MTRSPSLSSVSSREEENDNRMGGRFYNLRYNSDRKRGNHYRKKEKRTANPSTSKLQVINLSDIELTRTQIEVLSLGLSFSPTASFDLFSVMKDLNLFARKLVLKKLHEKSNSGEDWTEQELESIAILEDLSNEQDSSEILEQAFIKGIITKQLRDNLIPAYPKISCIYFIPKIHKNLTSPPGRPIVSGNGSLCETICKYLDFYLKPLVCTLPSYIIDTGDFLSKIEGIPLESDIWFVTMDIESLHTSIRHDDGIKAVKIFLAMTNHSTESIDFLITLLHFSLTHNYFIFKETIYLQNQGTAMGAAFAPSYANLFLGSWERSIFFTRPIAFIEKILFWTRFIDDIFLLWQGTEQDLLAFLDILNDNKINVKLTCKYSQTNVEFLDVVVSKGTNDRIETTVHRKEMAVNTLLHASSSHPQPLINGIPTGQFLRIKRIWSDHDSFKAQAESLSDRFADRGYSKRCIRKGWRKANSTRREDLLKPKNKPSMDSKVRFISTYSDKWPSVR